MRPIILTVYGTPVAQGRPRFARIGNGVRTYDPEKSRDWKQGVRLQALEQLRKDGPVPTVYEGAVRMEVHAYLPRPKTLPKRIIHHTRKPDADNVAKGVKDALKGVIYRDDSQVIELLVRKSYGDPPRVVIGLQAVDEATP